MADKPVGWRKDSTRHGLAAKGIKTGRTKARLVKDVALPKDLTQMTSRQRQEHIDALSKLPLKELRRRQEQTDRLILRAFSLRDEQKVKNFQVIQDQLMAAVDKREFGGR